MHSWAKCISFAMLAAGLCGPAFAADYYEPPVVEAPPQVVYQETSFGGWYLRGDVDYHWSKLRGIDYTVYGVPGDRGSFDFGDLKGAFSLGAGVGYQVTNHFRTDVTGDYWFKSKFNGQTSGTCANGGPCTSVDTSSYSAFVLLANAYADLGTWNRITPYVGAGIGGAHIAWDDLTNTTRDGSFVHEGSKNWRFAYALMAGASYCLTDRVKLDAGYRFTHINGGEMFGYAAGGGPGYDKGMNVHEVRAGLRYQFGRSDCVPAQEIAYEQPPAPVYK